MTQSSVLHPRQHSCLERARRPKMLRAAGAIVLASAMLGGAATLLTRTQAVGIADATTDAGISAPTRDDWYSDRALSAPPIARHVIDR
jgi:hypothetical protein